MLGWWPGEKTDIPSKQRVLAMQRKTNRSGECGWGGGQWELKLKRKTERRSFVKAPLRHAKEVVDQLLKEVIQGWGGVGMGQLKSVNPRRNARATVFTFQIEFGVRLESSWPRISELGAWNGRKSLKYQQSPRYCNAGPEDREERWVPAHTEQVELTASWENRRRGQKGLPILPLHSRHLSH